MKQSLFFSAVLTAFLLSLPLTSSADTYIGVSGIEYELDPSTMTASVTGQYIPMQTYEPVTPNPWILDTLTTFEGQRYLVTSIARKAFYGSYGNLETITIPNTITAIGDSAFGYCTMLHHIYCKALTPPTLGIKPFHDVIDTATLFVPEEALAAYQANTGYTSAFKNIVGVHFYDSESVVDDITSSSVTIRWKAQENVLRYTVTIYQNGDEVTTRYVDAWGNETEPNGAPSAFHMKKDTTVSSTDYCVLSIGGLDAGTTYDYTINGSDASNAPVYQESGTFQTSYPEGLETNTNDPLPITNKVIRDGILIIRVGDKQYNAQGVLIEN